MTNNENTNLLRSIDLILESIEKKQKKITQIKPPNPLLIPQYQQQLKQLENLRGVPSYLPYLSTGNGYGPFTELSDGSVKIDLINGIGINFLGHSHPIYQRAHLQSALKDGAICGNLLPDNSYLVFIQKLINQVAKSKLKHFWYATSGSLANDNALKILWNKTFPRKKIIAFEKAFAGRTIAGQNITWNNKYKKNLHQFLEIDYIPGPDLTNPSGSAKKTIEAIDYLLQKNGDTYSAIMIELIQGEAGFVFGNSQYYCQILSWAKKNGLYIWIDEIQTIARTTKLFAFQTFKLDHLVDIVTVGKALQICGTLYSAELNPKPGVLGGTFAASFVSLEVASQIIDYTLKHKIYGSEGVIHQTQNYFFNSFKQLQAKFGKDIIPYYGGMGLMISFQIGDSSFETTWKFLTKLFNNGVIAFSAGQNPARIRFLPSLMTTNKHIDTVFDIIEKTINDIFFEDKV